MTMETLAEPKALARQGALSRRRAVDPSIRLAFSVRLAEQGLRLARQWRPSVVSVFYPILDEPDTLALLESLAAEGVATALPVTVSRDSPLTFRRWRPGEPTLRGAMGIPEPPPDAEVIEPDLLFVPLAAFDRRGHRIGYGAGHYDRTLARLRGLKPIRAVGVAYAACEVEAVADESHDEILDYILTERELIAAEGAR